MEVLPCSESDGDGSEKNSNNKESESFSSKRKPLSKVLKSQDKEQTRQLHTALNMGDLILTL